MTSEEREELREQLKKELSALERSITTFTELVDTEVQSDANDWFTTKDSNPSKEINELALEKARKRILVINDVLARVDREGFGICTICGKPIPFGRMKAVPATTRCLSCH